MVLCSKPFPRRQQCWGVGGGVLNLSVFQDHRAQVKFIIVSSHAHPFLYCLWLLPRCTAEWSSCTETYGRKANIFTIAVLQNKFIDSHIKKLWGGGKGGGILVESVTIWNDIIY